MSMTSVHGLSAGAKKNNAEADLGDMHIGVPLRSKSVLARLPLFGSDTFLGKYIFRPKSTSVNLHVLIFAMLLTVSILPITAFYKWVEVSSFEKEISNVNQNHLTVARNLSVALSRYVIDMKSVFKLAVQNEENITSQTVFQTALDNFKLCHISILNDKNEVIQELVGSNDHGRTTPSADELAQLRQIAAQGHGEIVISGVRTHHGDPYFFVVQQLSNGKFAYAPWKPEYVNTLQKSIAFGERGHAMVVDQNGLVVAHPNAEWQATSKDASKLPVVQAMMAGQTGVMQFFSPPMNADMIAGYTFVPETGWGVMVPQPISELADRVRDVQSAAFLIAGTEMFLVVLISLWLSSLLARPLQAIAGSARELAKGNFSAHVGVLPGHTPEEIKQLAITFDHMASDLQLKTDSLQAALETAKNLAQERAELLEKANQANEAKSQFVSMVSHELRTPLTSIKGSLELLNNGVLGALPEKSKGMVSIACKNAVRLATMIDDLLDIERLDAGKMQYDFANVDLGILIQESAEANKSYGDLNGVTFEISAQEKPVLVWGDYNRMMQVMANLLSNASKFSQTGGRVDIAYKVEGSQVNVTVQDFGVGIPEAAKAKIFEKFVQVDSSDVRSVGGSGLGLGIVKMIAEEHGGTISFESQVNEGTTFSFKLPLSVKSIERNEEGRDDGGSGK